MTNDDTTDTTASTDEQHAADETVPDEANSEGSPGSLGRREYMQAVTTAAALAGLGDGRHR